MIIQICSDYVNNLARKCISLGMSLVKFIASGADKCSDETIEMRHKICAGSDANIKCDHFKDDWCTNCGCYLPIKITWKTEGCPIGKWPAEIIVEGLPQTNTPHIISGGCGGCPKKEV